MRTLVVTQNITLDGSIEMLDDWFEPQGDDAVDNSDLIEWSQRASAGADALVVGRRTFEDMRGYWRDLDDDPTGNSDYLNQVRKYVASSTITDPEWEPTTVLSGDPVDEVRRLKQADGNDIVVTGSITLSHALIAAGLIDEYRLLVYPTVQGRGRRLFPDGFTLTQLDLLETRPFRAGITLLRYRPRNQ